MQVTKPSTRSGRLPLLSARPEDTFPAEKRPRRSPENGQRSVTRTRSLTEYMLKLLFDQASSTAKPISVNI